MFICEIWLFVWYFLQFCTYVEVRISRSVSEGPFDFEKTRVDCTYTLKSYYIFENNLYANTFKSYFIYQSNMYAYIIQSYFIYQNNVYAYTIKSYFIY